MRRLILKQPNLKKTPTLKFPVCGAQYRTRGWQTRGGGVLCVVCVPQHPEFIESEPRHRNDPLKCRGGFSFVNEICMKALLALDCSYISSNNRRSSIIRAKDPSPEEQLISRRRERLTRVPGFYSNWLSQQPEK